MCVDEDWLISPMPTIVRGSGSPETQAMTVNPQELVADIPQELVTEHPQEPISENPQ